MIIKLMVSYLMHFIGALYIWGGNNPSYGVDCSGLINEGLKAYGHIKEDQDYTAQGIFDKLKVGYKSFSPSPHHIQSNDILFFGKSIKTISHVAIAIDRWQMLESGGGDRTTTTKAKAIKANAMVRVRPINRRSDLVAVIRL